MAATEEYVTSKQIQTRLKRSAGQLDGVLRMMDEGRPCDDVLV
ncbi:metal-sensing transcriptional repressor, partial [Lactiplantibacillus pentosus]